MGAILFLLRRQTRSQALASAGVDDTILKAQLHADSLVLPRFEMEGEGAHEPVAELPAKEPVGSELPVKEESGRDLG